MLLNWCKRLGPRNPWWLREPASRKPFRKAEAKRRLPRIPPPRTDADHTLARTRERIRTAHANHLGYPYNLAFSSEALEPFSNFLVNNLGDPYVGSHYASEVCELERQVIAWFEQLWECGGDDFWGAVGASGTEGNLWAIYLGREALPAPVLIHSDEAHYSIPKAGRILGVESVSVACTPDGAISLTDLSRLLGSLRGKLPLLALTCGTTMKGAHDDVAGALAALEGAGYGQGQRFVHLDGALNSMVLPFTDATPDNIRPSFRHRIDSLSASGHKMVGTPMPCGVLVTRRAHTERVASAISYLRSNDTTLMGSRNGHAVIAIWNRLMKHGRVGFRRDVAACLARTERLVGDLQPLGVTVLRNPLSLTVVFPTPSESIVRKYQLACDQGRAHAVVMPNVTDGLIIRFVTDYARWWHSEQRITIRETA